MSNGIASVPLSKIRLDGTQSRAAFDEEYARELAEVIKQDPKRLPRPVLFFDGRVYWIGDGFHRVRGHQLAGEKHVLADVQKGGQREALLYSVGANTAHGLRRTNADKRRAVGILLSDAEWQGWSNGAIANHCGVSDSMVGRVRAELSGEQPAIRKVTRNGTTYAMDTSGLSARAFNALSPEKQLELLQRKEEEAARLQEADEEDEDEDTPVKRPTSTARADDDGLETIAIRVPVLVARLFKSMSEKTRRYAVLDFVHCVRKRAKHVG